MTRNTSRWTDNPFRDPNASPEQKAWLDKRDAAFKRWRETGDETELIEMGLFPKKDGVEKEKGELEE